MQNEFDSIMETHGVKIWIDNGIISHLVYKDLSESIYEHSELDILKKTLHPKDRYLELGGGIGFTGIFAARILESPPVLVEANPNLCKMLSINATLNSVTLKVLHGAVEVEAEKATFFLQEDFRASSCRYSEGAVSEITVPILSLEALLSQYQPTYLMCDIEGSEVEVLGSSTIDGVQKLCIDLHPEYRGKGKTDTLIDYLQSIGLKVHKSISKENVVFFSRSDSVDIL